MDVPYAHGEAEVNSTPGLDSIFFLIPVVGAHKPTFPQAHGPTGGATLSNSVGSLDVDELRETGCAYERAGIREEVTCWEVR